MNAQVNAGCQKRKQYSLDECLKAQEKKTLLVCFVFFFFEKLIVITKRNILRLGKLCI